LSRPAIPAVAAAAAAACLAVAGCGSVDAALSRQWATVNFRPDTTASVITAAGRACGREPGVRPAPVPAVPGTAAAPASLRYDVSGATAADLIRFRKCLTGFSDAVLGVSLKDAASQG
jgi:hypothetical protein